MILAAYICVNLLSLCETKVLFSYFYFAVFKENSQGWQKRIWGKFDRILLYLSLDDLFLNVKLKKTFWKYNYKNFFLLQHFTWIVAVLGLLWEYYSCFFLVPHYLLFLCREALCIWVVRHPSICMYAPFRYCNIWRTPEWIIIIPGPRGTPWCVDQLIRFWSRSAQGQRWKVILVWEVQQNNHLLVICVRSKNVHRQRKSTETTNLVYICPFEFSNVIALQLCDKLNYMFQSSYATQCTCPWII